MKLKKGDTVIIITGKDRGKTGKIEAVLPQANRVVVTGTNMYKKHAKPSTQNPSGGILELSRPIHVSNVMFLNPETKKPTRIGFQVSGKDKQRIARDNQQTI
jgi:large subunit ribosomal protein L24